MNPPTVERTRTTTWEWGAYVAAGMAFMGFLAYVVSHSWLSSWPITLIQAALLTAVVFGCLLMWFWKYKTNWKFWTFYLCFLALHCIIWGWMFPRAPMVSIRILALSVIVEVLVMALYIAVMAVGAWR